MPGAARVRDPARVMGTTALIDDNAQLRRTLRRTLADRGWQVAYVSERVDLDQVVDVIILDLSLGTHSGLEELARLRAAGRDDAVVIYSNHTEDVLRRRCLDLGAMAVVDKCAPLEVLLAALRVARDDGRDDRDE